MAKVPGRDRPLSLPRRWIGDLLAQSQSLPIITVERRMDLSALAEIRAALSPRPAWPLIILKAYAIVAARRPELRRALIPFPYPRIFESEESIASLAIEREYQGELGVFFGLFRTPDRQSIPELMEHLARWKHDPVQSIRDFDRLLRYSRLPRPLRRFMWWYGLNTSGERRARNFGTFGMSVTAGNGASALNLISPLTTTMNYGLFTPDHHLDVRLHFDHRVLDGAPAARALLELEQVLGSEMMSELRSMSTYRQMHSVKSVQVIQA